MKINKLKISGWRVTALLLAVAILGGAITYTLLPQIKVVKEIQTIASQCPELQCPAPASINLTCPSLPSINIDSAYCQKYVNESNKQPTIPEPVVYCPDSNQTLNLTQAYQAYADKKFNETDPATFKKIMELRECRKINDSSACATDNICKWVHSNLLFKINNTIKYGEDECIAKWVMKY